MADVDADGLSKSTRVRTSCGGDSGDSASSSGSSLRFVRVAFCSRVHYLLQAPLSLAIIGPTWKCNVVYITQIV